MPVLAEAEHLVMRYFLRRAEKEENVTTMTWLPVGVADPESLRQARLQVHNAAQWLARAAHSYMRPRPGHAHLLLRWDSDRQALVTQDFVAKLSLELKPAELTLQFREDGRPAPHLIDLDDRTPAEVEAWMLVELLHRGIDRDGFSKALPYEVPNLMTGDAIPYMRENLQAALRELSAWLANAASVLTSLADVSTPPTPLWYWPELAQMALLLPVRADVASPPTLRAGLCLGDVDHHQPYFCVIPHATDPLAIPGANTTLNATAITASGQPATLVLAFLRDQIAIHGRTAAP